MTENADVIKKIQGLISEYQALSAEYKKKSAESKAEQYVLRLFDILGWNTLSEEIIAQKIIKHAESSDRVDYSFKAASSQKPNFYVEVKRFARELDKPEWVKQAIDYGKNGGARWVVLTNFNKIRIFNSDFYNDIDNAELFREIDLATDISNPIILDQLLLLSREACLRNALDEYGKQHKKWKESADVEDLLTITLINIRKKLSTVFYDQNTPLFEGEKNREAALDEAVQTLLDRIIFCRILEDNGIDEDRQLRREREKWEKDKRIQFYSKYLLPFFVRMADEYDSSIFNKYAKIDNLKVENDDFIPLFDLFYNSADGLRYYFDAIPSDVLGHVYENYLTYKTRKTPSKMKIEEEMYKRKQSGIYYTPEFLVDYLLQNTLGKKLSQCKEPNEALKIKVLDPACGSGTFLIRAFEEFRKWYIKKFDSGKPEAGGSSVEKLQEFLDGVLENCIYGIDLDPRAVELTRLNLFIRAVYRPQTLPKLHILCANSLITAKDDDAPFIFKNDFPIPYEDGGFDVIVTNPPWEKWKPNSKEFFEPYYQGFKSLPAQKAKAKIAELLKNPHIKGKWLQYNNHYEILSEIFRDEKNFKFQSADVDGRMVSGDLDLYKLFTEKVYTLLKAGGVSGMVMPSGIYTDLGAKGLRTMLFDKCKIESLYGFENRRPVIFPAVDSRYKPIVIVFKKGSKTLSFSAGFYIHGEEGMKKALKSPTNISVEFIKKANPLSWNIIEIKTPLDYSIVSKMLKYPHLNDQIAGTWNVSISRGFDMTNDANLFAKYGVGVPMLEGKNMHQYTKTWQEAPKPRYSVKENDITTNVPAEKVYNNNYWLAYRLVARSNDNRTMISTVIPPGYVCGNSLAIVKTDNNLKALCFLCGVLNSFVLDYLLRQKVSANVNMFYFLELPVPRLDSGQQFEAIAKKVAQLVATTDEFRALKAEFGVLSSVTTETDRATVQAKIDAQVAKLYGITKEELAHILAQFPIVDDRVKNAVMREFEAL